MLKPSDNKICTPHQSAYSLVIAVAKRARQIAEQADEEGQVLTEKPVDLAVHDFVDNKYRIIEPDSFEEE